ncbi:MAG TPA: ATP-binding protein [Gemmatimonadales bacterium]|nr:ATP-binding protein [Gemmatimonadales bacterium]
MRFSIAVVSAIGLHTGLSFVLFCATVPVLQGQYGPPIGALDHAAWTIRDGAPTAVSALAQSADGVLWIGAQTGLYSFDGVRFEPFEAPGAPRLPSVSINALLPTPDTSLWIGYVAGGVSVVARGRVASYGQRDGLPDGTITAIVQDSMGSISVATTTGLARLVAGRWKRYGRDSGYPGGLTSDLLVDRRGTLWAATNTGVFTLLRGASQFVREAPSLDPRGIGVGMPRQAPDGSVWGASMTLGLTRLSDSAGGAVPARPATAHLRQTTALLIDHRANAWMIDSSGFVRVPLIVNGAGHQSSALSISERVPLTTGTNAQVIIEDRERNVWVGTAGGIERFRETKFTPVLLPSPRATPAVGPAADGSVWVGRYDLPLATVRERAMTVDRGAVDITCIYRDLAGGVWFGGPSGMWHAAPSPTAGDARFARVPLPDVAEASLVQAIAQTLSGDLWLSVRGRMKGVLRRHTTTWSLAPLPPAFANQLAFTIVTDSADRTWLGFTGNRLVRVGGGDPLRIYSEADGLHVGAVTALWAHGPRLWIGGESGLTTLMADDHFHSFTATQPLRGITGIIETADGALWLNGIPGVTHIEAAEVRRALSDTAYHARAEQFDYHDGLASPAPQFLPLPTAIQGSDGRLWFTTERDVAWIDPSNIRRNGLAPPVQIHGLEVAGKPYAIGTRIALPVRTSDLEVSYTALSLAIPDRVTFRYRLIGVDTGWIDAGNRREAFYTNLQPGKYRFQVIAANEDGVWNASGAGVDIEIPPTFTQTGLFPYLVGTAMLGIVWLLALWRRRQIARADEAVGKLRAELARVNRVTSFAALTAAIAHEVNQPLAGIVANAETCLQMLGTAPPNLEEARETVRRLMRDGNRASEIVTRLRSLYSRKLARPEIMDLNEAAREVIALSRADLQQHRVVLQMEFAPNLPLIEGDRIQLQQVVLNLVRNAADAMKAIDDRTRELLVKTEPEPDGRVRLSVRDAGVGFEPDAAKRLFDPFYTTKDDGMGMGLSVCRSIIESHRGRLSATRNEGPGATFAFSLPAHR